MDYIRAMLDKLRKAADFIRNHTTDLTKVADVLATVQQAISDALGFLASGHVSRRAGKKKVQEAAEAGAAELHSDPVEAEEAVAECEKFRDELLAQSSDCKPVSVQAVRAGGIDWASILLPVILNVVQDIIKRLQGNTHA